MRATRPKDASAPTFVSELVDWGAGPRAGQFLIHGGKALAAMEGRFSVAIDDIRKIAVPVLRHRVSTNFQAQAEGMNSERGRRSRRLWPKCPTPEIPKFARAEAYGRMACRRAASRRAIVMPAVEKYLKPEVIRQIARLDLRAQFIVKGFLQGLHASPFHGFSVEFSEHRKYTPGDDPQDIDWLVYAKTDKYYIKKFEAETNITGYLVMDLSRSMGYTYRQELTKFEYWHLPGRGAVLPDGSSAGPGRADHVRREDSPQPAGRVRSGRRLGMCLSLLANLQPTGKTDIARSLTQIAAMLRHRSLVMLFTDLLAEPEPVLQALRRLRHGGHDVILFHILDEAEVRFPFDGMVEFEEPETHEKIQVDASQFQAGLSGRSARLLRPLPPRMLSKRHRLRRPGHQHAIRQGADRIPGQPARWQD